MPLHRRRVAAALPLALWLSACQAPPAPCPECPACPEPPPAGAVLSAWEARVAAEDLADLRAGVRPLREGSVGLCRGARTCEEPLGADPGELTPGAFSLHAALRVPRIGREWKARFAVDCQSLPDGPSTHDEKVYTLLAPADPEEGVVLSPLWTLRAPHKSGPRRCTWTLTPIRPDGGEQDPLRGAWSTPAPP